MEISFELYTVQEKWVNKFLIDERVSLDMIDRNFRHVLKIKFTMGAFEYVHTVNFNFIQNERDDIVEWLISMDGMYHTYLYVFDNIAKLIKYNNPIKNNSDNSILTIGLTEIDSIRYENKTIIIGYDHSSKFTLHINKNNKNYLFNKFKEINDSILILFEEYQNKHNDIYNRIPKNY